MSIRINSPSTSSLSTLRSGRKNRKELDKTLEKLSSGRRINRASDDAAGLAIAEQLGQALKGLEQGMENVYDGISLLQTADGGMDQMTENLHRMRELAMTAASGTLNPGQRDAIQTEFASLKDEVDRISGATEFNGASLLDGSAGAVEVALGTETSGGPATITMDLSTNLDAASLGLAASRVDGADPSRALAAIDDIDAALEHISAHRADLGATGNRLASAQRDLAVAAENSYAARSRIMDTDYAQETSRLTAQQIKAQMNNAVLSQTKGLGATALNLLK